jgi:nitric oxide reductase activation protein
MSTRETCPATGKLRAWLLKNERSQAWLAGKLLISPPSVHAWLDETSRPLPHLRETIEFLTNSEVAIPDWELPSEADHRERCRRKILGIESEAS